MRDNSLPETKTRYTADELRALPPGTEYWPHNGMGYMKNSLGLDPDRPVPANR